MSRVSVFLVGMSLLAVPSTAALADGEGTYSPTVFAAQVHGPSADSGVGRSFVFNDGEGGQPQGRPVIATTPARNLPPTAGSFQFNAGQNG